MSTPQIGDYWFAKYLSEEKLMGSKCAQCGAISAPPQAICANCHSTKAEWLQLTGRGKLAAFTCIAIGPPSMAAEGYGRDNPYCTGVVELEEKTRIVARIEGVDAKSPESIKVGQPLQAKFLFRGEGEDRTVLLVFKPVT